MSGVWIGLFFFFKQKTAYEMRISDWSSDVCSSDLRFDFGRCAQWWYSRVVFRPNQAKTPSLVQAGRSTPRAFVYDSDERCNGRAGCDRVAPIKQSSLVEQSYRRSHDRDGPGDILGRSGERRVGKEGVSTGKN